jgi:hypothetical protein
MRKPDTLFARSPPTSRANEQRRHKGAAGHIELMG